MKETEKAGAEPRRPLTADDVRSLSNIDVKRLDGNRVLDLFERVTDLRDSLLMNEVSEYDRKRDRWEHDFSDTQVFWDRLRERIRILDGDPFAE